MVIKLRDFGKVFENSKNKQLSFVFKSKKLKQFGLTNEQLMNTQVFPKKLKLFKVKERKINSKNRK